MLSGHTFHDKERRKRSIPSTPGLSNKLSGASESILIYLSPKLRSERLNVAPTPSLSKELPSTEAEE